MADETNIDLTGISIHIHEDDTSALSETTRALEEMTKKYDSAREAADSYKFIVSELTSQIDSLNDRISELTESKGLASAKKNVSEFNAIVHSMSLDDVAKNDSEMFNSWREGILNGTKTLTEAVSEMKAKYQSVLTDMFGESGESLDAQKITGIIATLDRIEEAVKNLRSVVDDMVENGVKAVSSASGAIETDGAKIESAISGITNSTAGMSEEAKASYESITNLVNAVKEYANIDSSKARSVSQTFTSIANIMSGSLGEKTSNNIIDLITRLKDVTSGAEPIRFDVSGITELKSNKAALNNLATYLPQIASVNVKKLSDLSKVDLTNFNNVKVSKSAIENIAKLTEAIQVLKDVRAKSVSVNADEKSISIDAARLTDAQALAAAKKAEAQAAEEQAEADKIIAEWDEKRAADEAKIHTEMQRQVEDITGITKAKKESANTEETMRIAIAEQNRLRKEAAELQRAETKATKLSAQASESLYKFTAAKNGTSSAYYQDLKNQVLALDNLKAAHNSGKISNEEYIKSVEQINAAVIKDTAAIKAAGEAHLSFGDRVKKAAANFSSFLSASRIIMAVYRSFRQAVQASIELDSAFTQLKIVTNATDSEMAAFSDTTFELAANLGRSATEVAKSVETFSRLGYALNDAAELAKYANILANTAAVDSDTATTGITSIIKGYNMKVEDAGHVADVLVKVGQEYAVSASELMTAFEKAGAALNATDTSFEKSAGLIAAANASVQNASTVGTALRTVSARIRTSRTDLEELGESVDDLADGFSKYANELKAITGFDIVVEGTTNEYKDLYEIMEGISGVWDKLSDTQRARVSEILGGKHMCRAA